MNTRLASRCVVLSIAIVPSLACADIAYSNYDPADESTVSSNQLYNYTASSPDERFGFSFTSAASGLITEINAAAQSFGSPSSVMFYLYADNGSGIPGDLLGAWSDVVGSGEFFHAEIANPDLQLTAGETYHFVLRRPSAGAGSTRWYLPDPTDALNQVSLSDAGVWSQDFDNTSAGAFQILVTPAPGSIAPLAIGLLAPARRRRLTPA
ncbi:MAG: hypothetical protein ACIARR_07555 [Phycisphaerales bacterium JB059]